jgi:ketosteroid isomerase-like protein
VREAAVRFVDGDYANFVACFHESVELYNEPELSDRPIIRSRDQLASWLQNKAPSLKDVSIRLVGVTQDTETGVVTEAIIVGGGEMPEAWRLTLAIRVENERIREVRVFRDRDSALASRALTG